MPQSITLPGQHIPVWCKNALLSGCVLFFCWGGVIAYWRMHGSTPGTNELMLYLLAMPAALLLVFWGGSKAVTSFTAAPAAKPPAQPGPASTVPPEAPPLAILAAALRSPHGPSVDELAAAIAGNKARADLDRELIDEDGFPVMTARSADASDDVLREEVSEWLSRNGMRELRFSEEQWRALTLASAVTADLIMRATEEFVSDNTAPLLELVTLLPLEWDIDHRRAAGMWLRHTAAQFGWPFDCVNVVADTTASGADVTPGTVFGRLAQAAAANATPPLALVVACASHIGQQTVDEWAASGTLFTSSQAQGAIPGEGAAGVLVTSRARAESIHSMAYVLLDRIEEAQRDAAHDNARRGDAHLLGEMAERVCRRAAIGVADITMVIADTGHRRDPMLELMGFASAAMPQLDATDDMAHVGLASGTCGAVPFITGLALSRYHVLEREAPVLCISNDDPARRCVMVVRSAISLP
jgi:hypothetical protein